MARHINKSHAHDTEDASDEQRLELTPTVSDAEVKQHLDQLLDGIALGGDGFVITRNGNPVAQLVPYDERSDPAQVRLAIDKILELQSKLTLGPDLRIEDLIDEGRS